MAESKDYRIIQALMERLLTIQSNPNIYENTVSHVFIPKKVPQWSTFPAVAIYWDEGQTSAEYFRLEEGSLDILLVYADGLDDEQEEEEDSYIYRYRNVHADVRRCLMQDPSLGGLATDMTIGPYSFELFPNGDMLIEAVCMQLKINRIQNLFNPYQVDEQ